MGTRPPNIIVILADDLGYGDLGCDGGKIIKTPNLDRMAAEGVRLTDFYASANICTPSRAGLLTGQYAIRHGLAHEVIQPADTKGLPPEALTIPRALKPDYATALIGKWHLGHHAPHWPPTLYGFDQFHGLPYSHDMKPLAFYDGGEARDDKVDFAKLTMMNDLQWSDTIYGAGAGMEPTASSVVADLVDVVRAMTSDPENRVPHLAFQPDLLSDHPILPIEACESAYYLRIQAKDHPGVLAQVASILSERGINIESIMQKEVEEHDGLVPMILLTHRVIEQHINDAIAALEALQGVVGPVVRIRVEHLN